MRILKKFKKKNKEEIEVDSSENKEQEEKNFTTPEEESEEESWISEEGQLAIDIYETPKKIVIKSTIAGAKPEDLDISLNNDMLTIRGKRERDEKVKEENYLYQECYWGYFSRSIILPAEVDGKNIDATLENGILTIKLTKIKHEKNIPVKVK
ncbi:MAG: Hsp20/alpha crystallin family protein [Patescibacteria group bacterium]